MLCPKGLSEHHTHRRRQPRALSAAAPRRRASTRVSWDDALDDDGGALPRRAGALRPERGRRDQHRPARHRGVLHARQAGAARPRHAATTTATRRCACPRRSPATSDRSAATALPAPTRTSRRADVILLIGANIAENHPILCRRLQRQPRHDAHRRRSARHQDGDDGRPAPAAPAAVGPRALNGLIHIVIEHDLIDRDYIERAHHRLRRAARVGARATRRSASPRSPASRPS